MSSKIEALDFEQTLMYGQYKDNLARFARSIKSRNHRKKDFLHAKFLWKFGWFRSVFRIGRKIWIHSLGRIGEDWPFLALLGIIVAIISFITDCKPATTNPELNQYIGWITLPVLLLMFAAGMSSIVSPQAIGSGIPEMKTVLRGVILYEYLSFRTLIAKVVGLACSLGSGLPLGKEGPFVHVGSMVAASLAKVIGSFEGVYDKDARMTEMLAAACAVGVATTFYAPIGGVLFSVEVTTDFFAVRNYWRGFFAACCAALVWRSLAVWFRREAALTSLFKTSFRTDLPFDPQELLIFALLGVVCGLMGVAYVRSHRRVVHYIRNQKKLNAFLKKSRFIYPGLVTLLLMTISFPPFIGQYMASTLSNGQTFKECFSNITWGQPSLNDSRHLTMVKHWSTNHTNIYANLAICSINLFWMSILASTIPVPSGLFTPIFKLGAVFGRLVGEIMVVCFPYGVPFSGQAIIPGGYSVVGAAAFTGAVTHTISITVIVFEMTGQMSHMIPVILSVLISNAICQKLELSIYDSVIQIKKLPFLPPIMGANTLASKTFVDDIMVRDVIYVWRKNCTYRDLQRLLASNPRIRTFPLVDNGQNMILLGSIHREELTRLLYELLSHEKRLEKVRRRNSTGTIISEEDEDSDDPDDQDQDQDSSSHLDLDHELTPPTSPTNKSRFEVSLVESNEFDSNFGAKPKRPPRKLSIPSSISSTTPAKSILKQTFTISTYSPHVTINANMGTIQKDSRLRQAFEDIFQKSLNLEDAYPNQSNIKPRQSIQNELNLQQRRVRLPPERIIDLTADQQKQWEAEQLNCVVDFNQCFIDPAPFQLVERTTIYKTHLLFSMLSLSRAYVTSTGRLVGVLSLKDLRIGMEKLNQGLLKPHEESEEFHNYLDQIKLDPRFRSLDALESLTETTRTDSGGLKND